MVTLEEKVETAIKDINSLHDAVARANWAQMNRDSFAFELEANTKRLKDIYAELNAINKEMRLLLEKNTPTLDALLVELAHELTVLEANVSMEKKKKMREEIVNEREPLEVPELYSSLQQRILTLSLKSRYNIDRVRNFLLARKTPFVKKGTTAKNLLDVLEVKEGELADLKQKNVELKRKAFFGDANEKSAAEMEEILHEADKKLAESVGEAKKSLKSHFAQINYVEGSFVQLKNRVEEVENTHSAFAKNAIEALRELKKERDFAKTLALEIEQETLHKRSEYTKQLMELEEKKQAIEERYREKYEKELAATKKHLLDKENEIKHLQKLVEKLEKEVKETKK